MYKLLTSQQQTSQLMYDFQESLTIRRKELTNQKTEKGTLFVRLKLKTCLDLLIKTKQLMDWATLLF